MAGRNEIRDPFQQIIDEAKRQIQPPSAPDRTSAANGGTSAFSSTPSQEITRDGEDEDGNVITFYDAMTELDSTESAVAFTGTEI